MCSSDLSHITHSVSVSLPFSLSLHPSVCAVLVPVPGPGCCVLVDTWAAVVLCLAQRAELTCFRQASLLSVGKCFLSESPSRNTSHSHNWISTQCNDFRQTSRLGYKTCSRMGLQGRIVLDKLDFLRVFCNDRRRPSCNITCTFSHLADALIQSDLQ